MFTSSWLSNSVVVSYPNNQITYPMYTQYFGLNEKPFSIAPDPRYLYMSELHREALAHLLYGISNEGCLILLTGDVGTGKTTVSRCLTEQLPEKTDIAIILNPKLTIIELFKTICEEFAIPVDHYSSSSKTYIDNLNSFLLDAHGKGRSCALLIDEAQNLDMEILEQLRLLTNLETNSHKLLQIILIGQPELRDMLNSPQLTQINQRITSRYHLLPLKTKDAKKYIQHRIQIAGGPDGSLFSRQAVKHVIKISKGIPRLINIMCDRSLLGAYAENMDHVDLKIMRKAVLEVTPDSKPSFFSVRPLTVALLLFLLGVCLPAGFYFSNRTITIPQLMQSEPQISKPTISDTDINTEPLQKHVIIINPVHYDTELSISNDGQNDPSETATPEVQ